MKLYLPSSDTVHGSINSLPELEDVDHVSSTEEEESEESEEVPSSQEHDDLFVEFDHILFSISSWHHNFKEIMPETYIISVPTPVSEMISANMNLLNVTDSPELQQFSERIDSAVNEVGGTAFIKNNWHAPKDAAMFSLNHLLKVHNVHDVLTFMMYSDTIIKDFDRELGDMPFCVAVRPWMDIHPATEFRCIVVHNELVGITPREWPKYYAHFKDILPDLIETVSKMFTQHIKGKFPAINYTFDVIYTSPDNVQLWDFGPLNEYTKLYAFLWDEINNIIEGPANNRPPVFRFLVEDCGILPYNMAYQQQIN